jgi:hypothetical protein
MAIQVVTLGQDTPERLVVPVGGVCGFQVAPSTVETMLLPSTAVHSSAVKQAIDPGGKDPSVRDQEFPPSVDLKMPVSATA